MEALRNQPPPFSIELLSRADALYAHDELHEHDEKLLSLLPASYRTSSDDVNAVCTDPRACVAKELDVRRLHRVFRWLWLAGRPMPPRPLHRQVLLRREIFVTEQIDMHLVWTTGHIFIKPIPRFLLHPAFWAKYLICNPGCGCSEEGECGRPDLWRCAYGFLFSYAALICHESDFFIAKDKYLIPREVEWLAWKALVEQLLTQGDVYRRVDMRFLYGELRLSRLNKIYRISQRPFLRGYMVPWQRCGAFLHQNFAWLASATVFLAIVLTAMQVGLATKVLADNDAFQSASYGLTIFAILGPLVAAGLVMLVFCYMVVNNWFVTVAYKKKRFQHFNLSEGP